MNTKKQLCCAICGHVGSKSLVVLKTGRVICRKRGACRQRLLVAMKLAVTAGRDGKLDAPA